MTRNHLFSSPLCRVFALGACLLCVSEATADDRFDQAIAQLVAKVSKEIDDRNVARKLVVGAFSPPPRLQAVGGVTLQQRIITALERDQFKIVKGGAFQLLGKFKVEAKEDNALERASIKIEAELLDAADQDVAKFSINLFGDAVLPLSGATVALPVDTSEKERQTLLLTALQKPPPEPGAIDSAAIRAAAGSPFAIEVYVLRDGLTLQSGVELDEADFVALIPERNDGHPALEIPRDRPYIIKLTNDADFEAAAAIYIDTLSMFTFSDDGPPDGHVLVPARGSAYIKGWFRNPEESNAFSVGAYSESAAASRLINESQVGAITATFAACWQTKPPDDEAQQTKGRPKGEGTRIDKPIKQHYDVVKRHIGKTRAAITVHYNRSTLL